ncbi:alpha/beta-hydrolase [Dichomitus squalens]|uniref:Alpha/beta-hydrolase n=1 Tax=Dichomitus squalens TaxID=114155 RepID=A0A4Q9M637_9APHY|nr:alpha/beta-hydrolase [Dichomitus squalens]
MPSLPAPLPSPFDPKALTFPPPPNYAPTKTTGLPALPSPPRRSLLDEWYTLSTHLVPAAYPRITPYIPPPALPQWTPNKEEYKAAVRNTTDAVISTKEKQWQGQLDSLNPNDRPLWNCVNRYVRKGFGSSVVGARPKGVTLFLAHPNGFPKEIWEPGLERLVTEYSAKASYQVDEIWAWEAANHGDACLINIANLGGIFDWRDNSRDILHFLLHYLPASASPAPLPTHLPRLSDAEADSRKRNGFQDRNLLSVGHSFGGASILRAAIELPTLFERLFLVEAMVCPMDTTTPKATDVIERFVSGAIQRRDGWSSREEAYKTFASTPFFAAWDPAVLEIYVQCALYDAPDGRLKLKMPGLQEGICFAEARATYETFELLPTLDERIEARWLVAGKLDPWQHWQRWRAVWRRPANTSHVRILESGHLIPQEVPSVFAKELHEFLNSRYGTQRALL